MKKKLFLIITSIVLIGTVCIWLLTKNKPAEQMPVNHLNEAVSHYTDMNIKDDKAYSLKVSDVQMLVTTYVPEYTVFGVSADAYTVRPCQMDETLTVEEQDLPICNFGYALLITIGLSEFLLREIFSTAPASGNSSLYVSNSFAFIKSGMAGLPFSSNFTL